MRPSLNRSIPRLVFAVLGIGWQPIHADTSGADYLMSEEQEAEVYTEELKQAWQLFRGDDPGGASKVFKQVAEAKDAQPSDRMQALFGMGLSYEFIPPEPQVDNAKKAFQDLIKEFPENFLVPWVLLELGKLSFHKTANLDYWNNTIDNQEARRYFRRILEDYPKSIAIHEAAVRLSNTYCFEVDRPESDWALEILQNHLKEHPDNPLAAGMHLLLTIWHSSITQDHEAAAPHAIRLGELQQSNPYRWSEVYWRVASIFHKGLGDLEEASRWYRKLIEVTPDARQAFQAQKELEKIDQKLSARGRPQ
jgi:tetratricopeptide (TPR) repeat protein